MPATTTTPLTPALEDACAGFVASRPEALAYHGLRFRDFLIELLGCGQEYVVALRGGDVVGLLPVLCARSGAGRICNSLPFFGTNGGPLAQDAEAARLLAGAWNDITAASDVLAATLVENPFAPAPPPVEHTHGDVRIAQFTDIACTHDHREAILARIDGAARRNVAKAQRHGFRVERDAARMDDLRRLHRENMTAIGGLPKPDRFFDLVPRLFREGEDFDLYTAADADGIAAALLLFYAPHTVEYYTPAIAVDKRPCQPLSLLLAEAMADAARRGHRRWNWGGTWRSQTGVYRFKRKWGAQEARYHYATRVNAPDLLQWPKARILHEFPHFYVVPFDALSSEEDSA